MTKFIVGMLVGMIFQAVVVETFATAITIMEKPQVKWAK